MRNLRHVIAIGAFLLLMMATVAACSSESNETPADEESDSTEHVSDDDAVTGSEGAESEDEMSEDDDEDDVRTDPSTFEGDPEIEIIESDIGAEVTSDGYQPEGDILVGTHGDNDLPPSLYLLSPEGEVETAWRITNRPGGHMLDRRVLDNGNIMFVIQGDGAYEMTMDGEIVWAYEDEGISHHGEILPNGNVLVAGAVCDCVKELDYESQEEVWSWNAHETFPEYDSGDEAYHRGDEFGMINIFANAYNEDDEYPSTWGHANYAQVLENDHVIVSLRNFDTILEINRDGETVWSYGPGIIKHQHTPVDLEDGTMLIFDNGNHRAIRIDRATGEILWSYEDLDSPIMGDVNLLDDGNYKVVDSLQYRVDIVSPDEEVLWSMNLDIEENVNGVYRAHFPDMED